VDREPRLTLEQFEETNGQQQEVDVEPSLRPRKFILKS